MTITQEALIDKLKTAQVLSLDSKNNLDPDFHGASVYLVLQSKQSVSQEKHSTAPETKRYHALDLGSSGDAKPFLSVFDIDKDDDQMLILEKGNPKDRKSPWTISLNKSKRNFLQLAGSTVSCQHQRYLSTEAAGKQQEWYICRRSDSSFGIVSAGSEGQCLALDPNGSTKGKAGKPLSCQLYVEKEQYQMWSIYFRDVKGDWKGVK
ncbi:hypothetical protein JX265_006785 [Neoarthrinium moseri]|uniref:Uncharacterized protein n=1 Tax=Neoarthrinium moseri TaxID=1658444 RepID=A0A9P9WL93_9PEZI|nr:hypothetical protein JX265_006785 [Neoarthrinium moseri]